ncbi:MAG: spore coat protein [Clostridia bacterium]|nr:spore coat protein [Clostridia bacterium]
MDDKQLMENLLLLEKGACDLFLHGAIESSTQNVNAAFDSALTETLALQDQIYAKMAAKGWYTVEQVEQQKINTLKQRFAAQA